MGRSPAADSSTVSASPPSCSSSSSHLNGNPNTAEAASAKAAKSAKGSRKRAGKSQNKDAAGGRVEVDSESNSSSSRFKGQKSNDGPSSRFSGLASGANPRENNGVGSMDNEPCFRGGGGGIGSKIAGMDAILGRFGLDRFGCRCRDGIFAFCMKQKPRIDAFYMKQKPRIDAFVARIMEWKLQVRSVMRVAWPPLQKGLLILCGIVVMLALGWVNCAVQGIKSLLRLGAAAFFMVICCCVLNLGILGGFFKLFISLALSAAAAFFLGYIYALAIFGIFSSAILWLYGSFWFTGGVILLEGALFTADRPQIGILVGLIYSVYSTKSIGGWFALVICLNLALIFSNLMIYLLHSNASSSTHDFTGASQGSSSYTNKYQRMRGKQSSNNDYRASSGLHHGEASADSRGASSSEGEMTSVEQEVERVLSCKDHYGVLELSRFTEVDVAALKRDYRKKAMLVHPDKNLGNVVAEEAFKRLQNAYETLLDPSKKQVYDDELKREEILSVLKRVQQEVLRNGRPGMSDNWFAHPEDETENSSFRSVICKKCSKTHRWIFTDRNKLRARWCQECQDYHQAKDGDGWIEQLGHTFFFGIFQKVDVPRAYACAESKIYEVTEWVQCQGMKCAANTHKPSFHVNAGIFKNQSKSSRANKTAPQGSAADNFPFAQMNQNMTEEEFMKWLDNAMASGMFSDVTDSPDQADPKTGNPKPSRKKRKGKGKW